MKRTIIYTSIIGALLLFMAFVILVSPVEKLQPTTITDRAIASHFWATIDDLSFELRSDGVYIEQRLPSDRFNELVQISVHEDLNLTAVNGTLEDGKAIIVANSKILSFIPSQYRLRYSPSVKNGRVILALEEAKIGRLPLSKSAVISSLAKSKGEMLEVDEEDNIVFIGTPRSLQFQEAKIEDDTLYLAFQIKINSITDVLELANFMMPEQLLDIIKRQLLRSRGDDIGNCYRTGL
ncbi:hypothetical protein BKP45_03305 [Anaerobacillus alkalidiazotrophicus]|uniref:Uncharacterized protein n=1 Tax=Anaerobacillus alkalidiazotrophicus TaxID=472963 RepID=A0A1S2MAP9_9BACI|nr:hypothetical protein [Anaerobacillus alkalidiazotrophicus]OIJ21739.1 hypothetical protein BKP45_03305 [Anaerobacillus alkalidiazotrophicus]